jgi:hypothetical protein
MLLLTHKTGFSIAGVHTAVVASITDQNVTLLHRNNRSSLRGGLLTVVERRNSIPVQSVTKKH